jgi:hypothetical protein
MKYCTDQIRAVDKILVVRQELLSVAEKRVITGIF